MSWPELEAYWAFYDGTMKHNGLGDSRPALELWWQRCEDCLPRMKFDERAPALLTMKGLPEIERQQWQRRVGSV